MSDPTTWTEEEYFADRKYVRKGWLDKISPHPERGGSPAKLKHYLLTGDDIKRSAAMEFGIALHAAILENRPLIPIRAKRGTKAWATEVSVLQSQSPAALPLSISQYDTAMSMVESINEADPNDESARLAERMLYGNKEGRNEGIFWGTERATWDLSDEMTWDLGLNPRSICLHDAVAEFEVPIKAKVDRVYYDRDNSKLIIIDLKTSADASPHAFQRSMAKYRYVYQQAFYRHCVLRWLEQHPTATGMPRSLAEGQTARQQVFGEHCNGGMEVNGCTIENWCIVLQSDTSKTVACYRIDSEDVFWEDIWVNRDMALYQYCKDNEYWPSATTQPKTLRLPNWYRAL